MRRCIQGWFGFATLLALVMGAPAQAIPVGWTVGVDGTYMGATDPDGVAYLSPVETQGLSFNQVMASNFVVNLGFQPMTNIDTLILAYNLPITTTPDNNNNGGWDSGDAESGIGPQARDFVIEFGATHDGSGGGTTTFDLTRGYLASAPGNLVTGRFEVALVNDGTDRGLIRTNMTGVANDSSSNFFGFWLVRSPAVVPEPGTFLLILLGLGVFAACRARR